VRKVWQAGGRRVQRRAWVCRVEEVVEGGAVASAMCGGTHGRGASEAMSLIHPLLLRGVISYAGVCGDGISHAPRLCYAAVFCSSWSRRRVMHISSTMKMFAIVDATPAAVYFRRLRLHLPAHGAILPELQTCRPRRYERGVTGEFAPRSRCRVEKRKRSKRGEAGRAARPLPTRYAESGRHSWLEILLPRLSFATAECRHEL